MVLRHAASELPTPIRHPWTKIHPREYIIVQILEKTSRCVREVNFIGANRPQQVCGRRRVLFLCGSFSSLDISRQSRRDDGRKTLCRWMESLIIVSSRGLAFPTLDMARMQFRINSSQLNKRGNGSRSSSADEYSIYQRDQRLWCPFPSCKSNKS
jgi:hypothetical protein